MSNQYKDLAIAIIHMAVKDWKKASSACTRSPNNVEAKRKKLEIEEFFNSEWYQELRILSEGAVPENILEVLND